MSSEEETKSTTVVYDKFFSNIETLSKIAEKGASHSLLTIGMSVIGISLLTKIKVVGASFLFLEQAEFIAFIIIGFLLMLTSGLMNLYVFNIQMDLEKERNKVGAELLRKNQETAEALVKPTDISCSNRIQI